MYTEEAVRRILWYSHGVSPWEESMGKRKDGETLAAPAFTITAAGKGPDEVRLQVDQILPASAAFEIVKILAGAEIDRARERKPRPVPA